MFQEFKKFAMRGNVMDMAVGIIIGVAFGKIVASLVEDVIMPPIGILLGGVDFSSLAIKMNDATQIRYGMFINAIINFVIVAFAVFLMIKALNKAMPKKQEAPAGPPPPTKDQVLLGEIRDLLKSKA